MLWYERSVVWCPTIQTSQPAGTLPFSHLASLQHHLLSPEKVSVLTELQTCHYSTAEYRSSMKADW